jgi:hypothetical protein
MHNGHLLALYVTMAFSTEKESLGNPSIFHALIFTGSPKTFCNENISEEGIPFSLHFFTQSYEISVLKADVNAPK